MYDCNDLYNRLDASLATRTVFYDLSDCVVSRSVGALFKMRAIIPELRLTWQVDAF